MASGKMKSFSSVGKLFIRAGMISAICMMPPAMAARFDQWRPAKRSCAVRADVARVGQPPGDFGHPPVSRL